MVLGAALTVTRHLTDRVIIGSDRIVLQALTSTLLREIAWLSYGGDCIQNISQVWVSEVISSLGHVFERRLACVIIVLVCRCNVIGLDLTHYSFIFD